MLRKYLTFLFPDGADGGGAGNSEDLVGGLMAEVNSMGGTEVTPPAPTPSPEPAPAKADPTPAPAPKPDPKPAAPAPAAKQPAAQPSKQSPPKPAEKKPAAASAGAPAPATLDWKSAPEQFRTAHETLLAASKKTEQELRDQITQAGTKIGDLEKRTYLTPQQQQRYEQLEKDQSALQAELYARNFGDSPEFRQKYKDEGNRIYGQVKENLAGVQVQDGENRRDATLADFNRIREGRTLVEQKKIAKALFGEDHDVFLKFAVDLNDLERKGMAEIATKRTTWEADRTKSQETYVARQREVASSFHQSDAKLVEKFPGRLGPLEGNQEFNTALESGLKYIDSITQGDHSKKPPAEISLNSAIGRRLAAAWFPAQVLIKQKDSRIAELEAQIKSLQGSDPGNAGDGAGAGGGGAADTSGTDDMVDEIGKLVG